MQYSTYMQECGLHKQHVSLLRMRIYYILFDHMTLPINLPRNPLVCSLYFS